MTALYCLTIPPSMTDCAGVPAQWCRHCAALHSGFCYWEPLKINSCLLIYTETHQICTLRILRNPWRTLRLNPDHVNRKDAKETQRSQRKTSHLYPFAVYFLLLVGCRRHCRPEAGNLPLFDCFCQFASMKHEYVNAWNFLHTPSGWATWVCKNLVGI